MRYRRSRPYVLLLAFGTSLFLHVIVFWLLPWPGQRVGHPQRSSAPTFQVALVIDNAVQRPQSPSVLPLEEIRADRLEVPAPKVAAPEAARGNPRRVTTEVDPPQRAPSRLNLRLDAAAAAEDAFALSEAWGGQTASGDSDSTRRLNLRKRLNADNHLRDDGYAYRTTTGEAVYVVGDKCFEIKEHSERFGSMWRLPKRCPWVRSESEQLAEELERAVKQQFSLP